MLQQEELLSVHEAGHVLHLCQDTVYKLIRAGELPFFRVGHALRIRAVDLDRYILHQSLHGRAAAQKPAQPRLIPDA